MKYLGYYKNGRAFGTFWAGKKGGHPYSHMHGTIRESDATISGDNISYIYPDMETSFVGIFENKTMKSAEYFTISEVKCNAYGLPFVSKFNKGKEPSPSTYYYHPPTNTSFGAGPIGIIDPFERSLLDLKKSSITNSGEGIYVKKDVKEGMLVALYSGYLYNEEQMVIYSDNCSYNISKSEEERRSCGKFACEINHWNETLIINIPPEIDRPGPSFSTLGPKVIIRKPLRI